MKVDWNKMGETAPPEEYKAFMRDCLGQMLDHIRISHDMVLNLLHEQNHRIGELEDIVRGQ